MALGDIALPAGTGVWLLTRPAGVDAATVDTPHEFRPERWLAPNQLSTDWRADLVPFGAGPRYCPGRGLALIETRLVLSMLYRNFDVEPVDEPDAVRERFAFAMEPTRIGVRLHHRTDGDVSLVSATANAEHARPRSSAHTSTGALALREGTRLGAQVNGCAVPDAATGPDWPAGR